MVTLLKIDGGGKIQKTEKEQIPPEIEIIISALHEMQEIAYATINQLMQLYGKVDYNQSIDKQVNTDMNQAALKAKFPADLSPMLDVTLQGDFWIIKPKQFLGAENFAKIGSVVRGLSGEYVSKGRESHFRIKKQ